MVSYRSDGNALAAKVARKKAEKEAREKAEAAKAEKEAKRAARLRVKGLNLFYTQKQFLVQVYFCSLSKYKC